MTATNAFEYTTGSAAGLAAVEPWQNGQLVSAGSTPENRESIASMLKDCLEQNVFAIEPACENAAAIYRQQDELFMLASPSGQCIVVYEDGLIDRAVDGRDREVIHNIPSAAVTVAKAVIMAVPDGRGLTDLEIRQFIYQLAQPQKDTEAVFTCAGLYDPDLMPELVKRLRWRDALQERKPGAELEVAKLEYQVSRNTAEKERLDAKKRAIQNQLLELDRQRDVLDEKREELYRQLEQLSGGYSRLVSEEKRAESRLRETIQNLVREQMSANHDLRKKPE